jgi:NTE family protein
MNKLQRILRIKPHRVALALGGGALYGAAHIGVLQVFEREGIQPDIVVGTSVGAMIGAAYAAGKPVEQMVNLIRKSNWSNLVKLTFPLGLSMFNSSPMEEFIRENIFELNFCDLSHPFAAVACDILTGKRVVLNTGSVAEAVRASTAVPGIFSPVEIGELMLVDGGVVDNLPTDVARDMGADYIIAVDLSSPTTLLRPPQNIVDLLFGVVGLIYIRSQHDPLTIDCLIHPDLSEFNMWSFNNSDIDEMMSRGRIAANQVILKLKKDLHV